MSYEGQKKAAEMERKGLENQNDANKYQNSIKRRTLIQQTRAQRGMVGTTYASSGVGNEATSSQKAAQATQRTQLGVAMRDSAILQNFGDEAVRYSFEAQRGNTFAALGSAVTAVGSTLFSFGAAGLAAGAPATTLSGGGSVTQFGSGASGIGAASQSSVFTPNLGTFLKK